MVLTGKTGTEQLNIKKKHEPLTNTNMANPKILIADDEVLQLETIIDIIQKAGCNYDVYTALNGQSALKIAQIETPI